MSSCQRCAALRHPRGGSIHASLSRLGGHPCHDPHTRIPPNHTHTHCDTRAAAFVPLSLQPPQTHTRAAGCQRCAAASRLPHPRASTHAACLFALLLYSCCLPLLMLLASTHAACLFALLHARGRPARRSGDVGFGAEISVALPVSPFDRYSFCRDFFLVRRSQPPTPPRQRGNRDLSMFRFGFKRLRLANIEASCRRVPLPSE